MKPAEFSEVGQFLLKPHESCAEGRGRSAVSRFYYAAFLAARDELKERRGWEFGARTAHDAVMKAFRYSDDSVLQLVGRALGDLKKLRVRADYRIGEGFDPDDAREAQDFCESVQRHLPGADLRMCYDDPNARS